MIDRELHLPNAWTEDGDEVESPMKPKLAQSMIEFTLDSQIRFGRVTGDEAYGQVGKLRLWLESLGVARVLAAPKSKNGDSEWICGSAAPIHGNDGTAADGVAADQPYS